MGSGRQLLVAAYRENSTAPARDEVMHFYVMIYHYEQMKIAYRSLLPRTNGGIYTSYVVRVVRVPETALMASSRDTIVSVEPPVVSDLVRGKFAQWNKGGQPPCS